MVCQPADPRLGDCETQNPAASPNSTLEAPPPTAWAEQLKPTFECCAVKSRITVIESNSNAPNERPGIQRCEVAIKFALAQSIRNFGLFAIDGRRPGGGGDADEVFP